MAHLPAIAPPVFVFQKDKAQKRSADVSSPEDGEESDREDGSYCPPIKRERTSSLTQFPPSQTGKGFSNSFTCPSLVAST
uniref:Uncharacterized protein n=1 Tax=Gopherus agassizii TaxID=38772 RepID=A0A452IY33_9SAUR